ncbi:hypothetical protein POTOM_011429 [Populus tomentosa]|uniref:Uncharacterized protein n=1 Tax=Populus tomentosa TaxID=118781 RepID=A0A8X8A8V3_POPTO|nr:hypothetical protein POTOM_011429 [Populus tomentosa]
MPPQVQNHGLFLPILLSTDQSQARQQLLSQIMQKCMASNGVQSSAGLQAALPPVSGVTQTIPNTVVQNPNMQNQSQARQQLLSQIMQKCMASNGVQSSVGLQAALPPVSGVTRTIPNTVFQNPNMQSIPGVSQNSVGNSMGQGIPSTMFANSQRQMPGNALFGSFMCHCCHLWH